MEEHIRRRSIGSKSDFTQSQISFRSVSNVSKSSISGAGKSIYSTMGGSKWGGTIGDVDDYALSKLDIKPSIQEQNAVTHEWWQSINPLRDVYLPILEIKKLLKNKKLVIDIESAAKQIVKYHGKKEQIDYEEFYEMFCKGIFRVAM